MCVVIGWLEGRNSRVDFAQIFLREKFRRTTRVCEAPGGVRDMYEEEGSSSSSSSSGGRSLSGAR